MESGFPATSLCAADRKLGCKRSASSAALYLCNMCGKVVTDYKCRLRHSRITAAMPEADIRSEGRGETSAARKGHRQDQEGREGGPGKWLARALHASIYGINSVHVACVMAVVGLWADARERSIEVSFEESPPWFLLSTRKVALLLMQKFKSLNRNPSACGACTKY